MKNKLKVSIKILILILVFAGIVALIPTFVSAWSESALKSGVTIGFRNTNNNTYKLANGAEGLYCIQKGAIVGNRKNTYSLKYKIVIEGWDATLYNASGSQVEKTKTSNKNAKMAYILGGGTWSKKYGSTTSYTPRQLAIFSYWNTFISQWSKLKDSYAGADNSTAEQTTTSKKILSKAEDYATSSSSGASVTAVTEELNLKSSEIKNNRVGAFKVKYTGTPTLTVYDSDGNKVKNYKIYSSKTSSTELSTIPNNKSFYIWTSDGDIGSIKISITSSDILTATIYILKSSNSKQRLIAVDTDSTTQTAEVTIPVNITNVGKLKIVKKDSVSGEKISGMKFKVQTSEGWLQNTSSGWKYDATFENATEFKMTDTSGYTLSDLDISITYRIWETQVPNDDYELSEQENYDSSLNAVNLTGTDKWITLSKGETVTVRYKNEETYISISGYVWIDDVNKSDNYNNELDDGETKVEGVTVYLKDKDDDEIIATTTTDENGYYIFDRENKEVSKNEVENYYIEFDYKNATTLSDTDYIPVAFNSKTASEIVTNGSRALMDEVAYEDEDLDGVATTYTGTDSSEETLYGLSGNLFDKLYNEENYTLEYMNLGLIPIYDPDYSIKENLYYVKIVVNGYEYMYEYGVDYSFVEDDDTVSVPTVSFQDGTDIKLYTRYIYPSDIANAILTEGESLQVYVVYGITIQNDTSYSVSNRYVEQQLHITSLTNTFDSTRYELDTSSNIEDDDAMNDIEKAVNDDFKLWNESSSSKATYTGGTIDLNPYSATEGETDYKETVYIQFKVTLDGITEILNNPDGIYEDYPTDVSSDGYHTYTRNDYSWENNIYKESVEHKTSSKTKNSSAPYLVFKLPDSEDEDENEYEYINREISGVIFEDTDVTSGDDDALGNGQYDSNSENTVANVTVALVDSDGNAVYQYAVYKDGEYYLYEDEKYYEYDESSDEYVVMDEDTITAKGLTSDDALITATSNENGEYTLSGMVPGEYTLKFTYYDENNTNLQTTINGNTISINDYKSTIVTSSSAADAIKGNDSEGEWYKDYDGDGNYYEEDESNYSVAVDDLDQREEYNENYDSENGTSHYTNDGTETYITKMEAETATFDITVENTADTAVIENTTTYYVDANGNKTETVPDDDQILEYTKTTDVFIAYQFTGFNFGIITQPEQSIEIEKVITNVKLVNTPTTIFDGNPQTDSLSGVSDLDGDDSNNASTYTRIEIEEDLMYGSELTVTYEIIITNTSDINYWEPDGSSYYGWYYMFGEVTSESQIVYIDIDLYDYLDYDLTLSGSVYEIVYTSSETTTNALSTSSDPEKVTISSDEYNSKQNSDFEVTKYEFTELTPIAREEEGASTVVKLTATKVLSTSDDDMAYSNIGEITKASNSDSTSNKEGSLKLVRTPILPDASEAYITISPPTGGDTSTILIYVIAGLGMLMILSIGIVFIKKKVL